MTIDPHGFTSSLGWETRLCPTGSFRQQDWSHKGQVTKDK